MTALCIAIFVVSAAALGLELVLVRSLSIGHWHHFSYLVISTALLGFGAGGIFTTIGSRPLLRHYKQWLWLMAVAMGAAVPVAFYISQNVPFDELQLIWDRRQLLYLFAYYLLYFVPFLCAGAFIALIFATLSDKAHRLYFFNMAGSGLGAGAAVALMYENSPERLLLVVSCAGFIAAAIIALKLSVRWVLAAIVCAGVCLIGFCCGPLRLQINMSQHKAIIFYRELPQAEIPAVRYSPLARLDCLRAPAIRHFPGLSMVFEGTLPEQMLIISDGDGISAVTSFENNEDMQCYDYMTSALCYHLCDEPQVCIIGAGGGSDVAQALSLGARKITAVEMNPQVVGLVRGRFNDFASGLYKKNNVDVIVAEGRSFLETAAGQFDIISISMLDSYSASAAGLYALNESHLYTIQAIEQALQRLRPEGLLSITRLLKTPPRDSLKMLATVAETLRSQYGLVDPAEHIVMIRGFTTTTMIASPKPLSAEQVESARGFAQERSFDVVHVPGIQPGEVNRFHVLAEGPVYYDYARRILSGDRETFYRDYAYNIRPATDDRPYFFDFFKWRSLPYMLRTMGGDWLRFSEWGYLVLVATLLQAILAGGVFILLPLWVARPVKAVRSGKGSVLVYFLLLGLAYMFLEMGFIQKMTLLIGHPVFGVAVTLVSFLLFSGFGSLACSRLFRSAIKNPIPAAVFATVVVGITDIALLRVRFDWLVSFGQATRIMLGLAITAPLAFFMGMPFPAALKALAKDRQVLVPWAWGINGFASVTGAVLGTLLAISVGFTMVAAVALGCYLAAAAFSTKICTQ